MKIRKSDTVLHVYLISDFEKSWKSNYIYFYFFFVEATSLW